KIEHGTGKMLIRFAYDLFAALIRKLITERHAQITQRDAPAPSIKHRGKRAEQKSQAITSFARQERHEFRRKHESQPLESVPNLFRRAHPLQCNHAWHTLRTPRVLSVVAGSPRRVGPVAEVSPVIL